VLPLNLTRSALFPTFGGFTAETLEISETPETLEGSEILESLDTFQDTWPLAAGDTGNRCSTDVMPQKIRAKPNTATAKSNTATITWWV